MIEQEYLALLYRAQRSPRGLVVKTDSAKRLRARLYKVIRANPDLKSLVLTLNPNEAETSLLILKKEQSDG